MKCFSRGAAVALSFVSACALAVMPFTIEEVNLKVAEILKPMNNDKTVVELAFTQLSASVERVVSLALGAQYSKSGPHNHLEFTLTKLSYNYPENGQPITEVNAQLKLDLVKAVGQEQINELGPGVDQLVKDFAADYTSSYGEAVTIDAKVDETLWDENQNLTSVKFHFNFDVDLAKPPEGVLSEDVFVKAAQVEVSVDLGQASLRASLESNPQYRGFQSDNSGLKEFIDDLLSGKAQTYERLKGPLESLDGFAEDLVNSPPQN